MCLESFFFPLKHRLNYYPLLLVNDPILFRVMETPGNSTSERNSQQVDNVRKRNRRGLVRSSGKNTEANIGHVGRTKSPYISGAAHLIQSGAIPASLGPLLGPVGDATVRILRDQSQKLFALKLPSAFTFRHRKPGEKA